MTENLKTTLIAGFFTLVGAIGGTFISGLSQIELAERKFNSDLIMKALESNSPEERLASLNLLLETNLLKDNEIKEGVANYTKAHKNKPFSIPQIKNSNQFETPTIPNSRIYLLCGSESKKSLLSQYKQELESAGFQILGSKLINDPGRPISEEVRYFNSADTKQAEKIAEVLKFKLSLPELKAKLYSDQSAKPGYIEIWFGK
ncbi:hypothetical protein [Flavobacterium sp. JAS]|uniref:hypothetical protein n=1 Tax=Flavobacterium sp. JAS TaxID=2897329 RepID=UPI001E2CAE50|nr:hypothetical protein [Flavobacterium sp. JAS]MCD0472406.1 hypothetical protein [Flavobacterium sp. JAS]